MGGTKVDTTNVDSFEKPRRWFPGGRAKKDATVLNWGPASRKGRGEKERIRHEGRNTQFFELDTDIGGAAFASPDKDEENCGKEKEIRPTG